MEPYRKVVKEVYKHNDIPMYDFRDLYFESVKGREKVRHRKLIVLISNGTEIPIEVVSKRYKLLQPRKICMELERVFGDIEVITNFAQYVYKTRYDGLQVRIYNSVDRSMAFKVVVAKTPFIAEAKINHTNKEIQKIADDLVAIVKKLGSKIKEAEFSEDMKKEVIEKVKEKYKNFRTTREVKEANNWLHLYKAILIQLLKGKRNELAKENIRVDLMKLFTETVGELYVLNKI